MKFLKKYGSANVFYAVHCTMLYTQGICKASTTTNTLHLDCELVAIQRQHRGSTEAVQHIGTVCSIKKRSGVQRTKGEHFFMRLFSKQFHDAKFTL